MDWLPVLNSDTWLLPLFVTHRLPLGSNTSADGVLNPPIGPARVLPLLAYSARALLPLLVIQTFSLASMAIATTPFRLALNGLPLCGTPRVFNLVSRDVVPPVTKSATHTLPVLSMASALGLLLPSLKLSATVQSCGAGLRVGWKATTPPASEKRFATFVPGCRAISSAASSVFPGEPVTSANKDAHPVELEELVFTQEARISASVLISCCGTTPLPFGVTEYAVPSDVLARLDAV